MQSFLELLEYENKSPEDPHVLDEWVICFIDTIHFKIICLKKQVCLYYRITVI